MFARVIIVSYEGIHRWSQTFGLAIAAGIRRRPQPKEKWHMDEMHAKMNGRV